MKSPTPVDVLVIGLGPAGAAAAAAAAGDGRRVMGVDRREQAGEPVQCAEFVPSLIGLEVADLSASIRQAIEGMVTYVETEAGDHSPDFRGVMISRADFDRDLVKKAEGAGVDCRFSSPVRAIAADGAVELASGEIIRPRIIIGADGPRSFVGRTIGRVNEDCVESRQITVPLKRPHNATDIFLSAAFPGGYGWLFPKGEVANLGIGLAPQWKDQLKPLLDTLHRRLVDEGRVGAEVLGLTGGLIPVGGMLKAVGHLGPTAVFLAGDAAGLANPVTGAGISAAVISGTMAGRAARALLSGRENAAADYIEELDDLFGPSLARALKRRQALLDCYARNELPQTDDLRVGWIAYPEYWAA
jgi:geranylgeranyl reductase family protein